MGAYVTITQAISEWKSKRRRMGCVSAANFFCTRVPGFHSKRIRRYTQRGEIFEHVVCTDGKIVIDLAPYADGPD
jgi:hypothetical protein